MSKLNGLRKNNSPKKEPELDVDAFINDASIKTAGDLPERDEYKHAKRDQSFLLKLNHYETDLINKAFDSSSYRSKLELVRALLIPALEDLVKKQ